jgi:hypothetical protein
MTNTTIPTLLQTPCGSGDIAAEVIDGIAQTNRHASTNGDSARTGIATAYAVADAGPEVTL